MTSFPAAIFRTYRIISNAIISETKDFFFIFYCISEMWMKFRPFSKKNMSIIAKVFPKLLMLKYAAI